ncbi:hypothetical protein QZM69_38930, partial [Burkholderia aenigmatica]|nr:hypothetical protein [Burkholderia aenigmatica]
LRMAAGGGLVTVVTVCVKFAITGAHLQSMLEGPRRGVPAATAPAAGGKTAAAPVVPCPANPTPGGDAGATGKSGT